MSLQSWQCDGIPKNGKQYPNCSGEHEPYENFGPDCVMCGLPREAMESGPQSSKTVMAGGGASGEKKNWLIPGIIVALLILAGVGFGVYKMLSKPNETVSNGENGTPSTDTRTNQTAGNFISDNAQLPQLISQGEKILLESNPDKENGARAFSQQDWDQAIAAYQQSALNNPNEPEAKIYLQNAQAQKSGNPLTIAVAVPMAQSPDSAKEILRGVSSYQEEFNQSPTSQGRLLEVVLLNNSDLLNAKSLAEDVINAPNILGVLGYGIDPGSQKALQEYENAGLAALSPLSTSVTTNANQSTLQIIPIDQKSNELLGNYLEAVSKTLLEYANQQKSPPSVIIFYNSDSPYSMQFKQKLNDALPTVNGKLIKEVDTATNTNPAAEIANNQGANTMILALSKNKVPEAISLAQANSQSLTMVGGDELYNPDILIQGGDAIENLVLAVPWSFKPNDPFASEAVKSWKGRVSWRTATSYDATKALVDAISQSPTRSDAFQLLNQGISLANATTDFNIFQEVPLVKAVQGNSGPPGSKYQFDPIP